MFELVFFKENFFPIKIIAEYVFCPFSAFYMYVNWLNNEKNIFLFEGSLYHERSKKICLKHRNGLIQKKNILIFSKKYKIYGFCDLLEITNHKEIYPVEYKFSLSKIALYQKVQLALEVLCINEMFKTNINYAFIYFYKKNQRVKIRIDNSIIKFSVFSINNFRKFVEKNKPKNLLECKKVGCSYFDTACKAY